MLKKIERFSNELKEDEILPQRTQRAQREKIASVISVSYFENKIFSHREHREHRGRDQKDSVNSVPSVANVFICGGEP